jgi:hypothetical protein
MFAHILLMTHVVKLLNFLREKCYTLNFLKLFIAVSFVVDHLPLIVPHSSHLRRNLKQRYVTQVMIIHESSLLSQSKVFHLMFRFLKVFPERQVLLHVTSSYLGFFLLVSSFLCLFDVTNPGITSPKNSS